MNILEILSGDDGTLSDERDAIHFGVVCLEKSMPMLEQLNEPCGR